MMSKFMVLIGAGLVAVAMICVTVLAALGKDTQVILNVINMLVVPLLGALVYSQLKSLQVKTDNLRDISNGNTDKLLGQNSRLVEIVAQSPPVVDMQTGRDQTE